MFHRTGPLLRACIAFSHEADLLGVLLSDLCVSCGGKIIHRLGQVPVQRDHQETLLHQKETSVPQVREMMSAPLFCHKVFSSESRPFPAEEGSLFLVL